MRRAAPLSLALLPLLLLGSAACQSAPGGAGGAPAVALPPAARDDARGGADAEGADAADAVVRGQERAGSRAGAARIGDTVTFRGRELGRHLQAVLHAYVDPAVSAAKEYAPAAGKRWVGAGMRFVNVGGASYGALGSMWAIDAEGVRHPSVPTGELTTGKPLPFDSLAVGEQAEGWVVFEIPENVRIVRLQYRDANMQANSGEGFWQI
ncbi:hypothetical protein [Streptomyces sp. NPDC086023]|uniref:hypothetical protein n=1 Tax=Streptomyces sp. NPDC086023 TaxID=3365746 RepID=UPI0037D25C2F